MVEKEEGEKEEGVKEKKEKFHFFKLKAYKKLSDQYLNFTDTPKISPDDPNLSKFHFLPKHAIL